MKFYFKTKSKPRKKIIINSKGTFFGRGFKTSITSDPEIAGESSGIVEILSEAARETDSKAPLALSHYAFDRLEDYDVRVKARKGIYEQEGVIRLRGGYILIDELQEVASQCSE